MAGLIVGCGTVLYLSVDSVQLQLATWSRPAEALPPPLADETRSRRSALVTVWPVMPLTFTRTKKRSTGCLSASRVRLDP